MALQRARTVHEQQIFIGHQLQRVAKHLFVLFSPPPPPPPPPLLLTSRPASAVDACNLFHGDKSSSTYVLAISFLIINHNKPLLPYAPIRTYVQCTESRYIFKVKRCCKSPCISCTEGFYCATARALRQSWHLFDTYLIASSYLPIYLRCLSSLRLQYAGTWFADKNLYKRTKVECTFHARIFKILKILGRNIQNSRLY